MRFSCWGKGSCWNHSSGFRLFEKFLLDSLLRVLVFGESCVLDSLLGAFVLSKRLSLDSLLRVLVFGESCVLDSLLGVFVLSKRLSLDSLLKEKKCI